MKSKTMRTIVCVLTLAGLLLPAAVRAHPANEISPASHLPLLPPWAALASGGIRSIAGSTVTPEPDVYTPGRDQDLCFLVWNDSTDAEWLNEIKLAFPMGWIVNDMWDLAGPNDGGYHYWDIIGINTNVATWLDGDGGDGEQEGQSDHYFCVDVNVPGSTSGDQTVIWTLKGDEYGGVPPHTATGSLVLLPPGANLSTSWKSSPPVMPTSTDIFTYTLGVVNSGALTATATYLTDNLPAGVLCLTDTVALAGGGVLTPTQTSLEWSGELVPGDAVTITFAVSVTAAFECGAAIVNQATITAPAAYETVIVSTTTILRDETPVYFEDFEAGYGGYTNTGSDPWEWGVPTGGPGAAHSGSHVWATNLVEDYVTETQYVLVSPAITLPCGSELFLSWWQWYATEEGYDYISVAVDDGTDVTSVYGPVSGAGAGWQRQEADLSRWAGKTVRLLFKLTSDEMITEAGWYLDDVAVTQGCPMPPAPEFERDLLSSSAEPGASTSYTLTLLNRSLTPITAALTYSHTWPLTGTNSLVVSACGQSDFVVEIAVPTSTLTNTIHTAEVQATSGSFTDTAVLRTRAGGTVAWTFMVYMGADNNLEPDGVDDFLEMSAAGSSDDVNIVVQFDRIPGYDTRYGDWTGTRRFYVTKGMTPDPGNAVEDIGEANMGDGNTLRDFVSWTMEHYPAENYALILWDHGSGWEPARGAEPPPIRAIVGDDTDGHDYMDDQEIMAALSGAGLEYDGADKLALIGFDACLMGMIEVATDMSHFAHVVVHSEETEPGGGWEYTTPLQALVDDPFKSPDQLGHDIVEAYYVSYGNDETQSALNTRPVPFQSLLDAIDQFALALIDHVGTDRAMYGTVRSQTQNFEGLPHYDLYDFAERIQAQSTYSDVQVAAQAVMDGVNAVVIHERHGAGWPGAHGVAIYFDDGHLAQYLGSDDETTFGKLTRWDQFLQIYYNSGQPMLNVSGAVGLTLDVLHTDTTVGATNHAEGYGLVNRNESGPEDVFHFTLSQPAPVYIALDNYAVDLDLFLLDGPNEFTDQVAWGDDSISLPAARAGSGLPAGDYYVVVDGHDGAEGPYTIFVSTGQCDPVAGVDFSHDGPVLPGRPMHFTATVTPPAATAPITYEWDFGGAGVGSGMDTITPSFTYTASGTYDVVVTATNRCSGPAVATHQVQVTTCATITNVSLALMTPAPIFTDTLIAFQATISPVNVILPITYTLLDGGAPLAGGLANSTTFTVTWAFTQTGVHTLTLKTTNYCESEPVVSNAVVLEAFRRYFVILIHITRNWGGG